MFTPIQALGLAIAALALLSTLICVAACMLSSSISQREEQHRGRH